MMPPESADDSVSQEPHRPTADASSRYHAVLEESAKTYPLAAEALMRSDRHRLRRWQQFIDPIDLEAIESLLHFLEAASQSLNQRTDTRDIAFLPEGIANDVRMSLEGILSGYLQIASDALRGTIEAELLIRDFACDPHRIDLWRTADEDLLRRQFSPNTLRQRQANFLGVKPADVPGATDYAAHSQLLHLGPPRLFQRSPESGHHALSILTAINDIMTHAASAAEALGLLLEVMQLPNSDCKSTLAALRLAREDLNTADGAVVGLERLIAQSLSGNGQWTASVFENGLVVAVNFDTKRVAFYGSKRIDFRHFHREVTGEHPASFELTPLGESDLIPS